MRRALGQVEPPRQRSRASGTLTGAGAAAGPAPRLWWDEPGGTFTSSAEENAESEAKLCPSSSRAATAAAQRQG